ncbi:sugar ABC transporter ATP-binding protein [Solibacillus merdavium]|uniref:Sugar ABC transporter ATP-binding protein n=1 Tax=Solibacillus merdavium TaxID=2762218 RepID=A0ABR8XNY0_9BACL|nr:sugar ABC transporter ATP-binding protein [Solibacillus merdavium]MBD8033643.1 sugar ABC transporter ATP-binding protein [Solibacillus merdavium]
MIEMKGIKKAFNRNVVLNNVEFTLLDGEIHALMGENGAGKSTMMKILAGIYSRDEGDVLVDGQSYTFTSAKDAESLGIHVIHQELNILPHLSVAENLFLGKEKTIGRTGFLRTREMNKEAQTLLAKLGLHIDVRQPAGSLSVGKQQLIEIAKAINSEAKYIVMDEPTAALTDREIETLFDTIRELKAKGLSFVYISHRMEEIFAICDRITILRDGEYVGVREISKTSFDEIVKMMVGRELGERYPSRDAKIGEVALEVKGLTCPAVCKDINFQIRKGEILAFAGLMGAGRTEVAQAIFGNLKKSKGDIFIHGEKVTIKSPIQAMKYGIGFVTEDRKTEGLVLDFSIKENMFLTNLKSIAKGSFIQAQQEQLQATKYIEQLNIRCSDATQSVGSLSGGNQQKVVIAKWLSTKPDILILDEPTRGVDIGAKKEIYSIMNKLAEEGVAILMISSELPEVLGMADRVIVMHEGRQTAILDNVDLTQETIMNYATGGEEVVKN